MAKKSPARFTCFRVNKGEAQMVVGGDILDQAYHGSQLIKPHHRPPRRPKSRIMRDGWIAEVVEQCANGRRQGLVGHKLATCEGIIRRFASPKWRMAAWCTLLPAAVDAGATARECRADVHLRHNHGAKP